MRNLFLLLWRNNFFILFILLEVLCFYLIVQNSKFQRAAFINSANAVSANIYETKSYVREYIGLKKTNQQVAAENAMLRTLLPESKYDSSYHSTLVKDTTLMQQYTFIAARVINNSVIRRNNYLTLDKGEIHGVKPEMGVISGNGVIGIVKNVSPHYSTVMSVLHKDSKVSARFKKNQFFGSLVWDGLNPQYATFKDIPAHVSFTKGDTIVTTPYSSVYPDGIPIGTIESSELKPGENFFTIHIRFFTSYQNLSYVYIVNNLLKKEQKELESSLPDAE
jgi:rod shape-determining protein MreC